MSQSSSNNGFPQFSFNTSFYGAASSSQSVGDASFTQWNPHAASSSRGNNVPRPSPSPTFRSPRSVSGARPVNPMNFGHAADPSLSNASMLAVPSMSRSRTVVDPHIILETETMSNANPLARFYNEDEPWSTERPRNPITPLGRYSFSQPSMEYGTYREGPSSDIDSITPRSDSGYHTHPPHSIISNDLDHSDQALASDVALQVGNVTVNSAPSEPTDIFRMPSVDQVSQYSGRSQKEFRCIECTEVSKCKSDHKKHMLKHSKPFKCDIPNCRRGPKGFTTINDLNRHRKSVHRIGAMTNSYQCASETCRNKEKIWPRLDNFKQHINRMHQGEDEADLIRRSQYRPPEQGSASEQPLSVAPMDTTLIAGIGTEKQFPSNDSDDSVPGISLTPDQGTTPWNFNSEVDSSFDMEVDQSNFGRIGKCSRQSSSSAASRLHQSTGPARTNSLSLDALALASEQVASSKTSPQPRTRQLSTAPQTKADQQKQALKKFSEMIVRDIQNSSNDESVDLESVIRRVLSGVDKLNSSEPQSHQAHTAKRGPKANETGMSKTEALKASQALSSIIKHSTLRTIGTSSRLPSFSPNAKKCGECGAALARSCDLRKHMKRHTKPYGCTYPKCNKRFGAKSDWKRHENSQHFQLESFRCGLPVVPGVNGACAELFYRADMFKHHLTTEHKMGDDTHWLDDEVKKRRIGKNGQGQFYCGFCCDVIPLKKKRNDAWDERFDHIDAHFSKDKMCIENWLCVEAKKTKGDVQREMDRDKFDDYDESTGSPEEDSSSGDSQQEGSPEASTSMPKPRLPVPALQAPSSLNKKRRASQAMHDHAPPPSKRSRTEVVRYCCVCQNGPYGSHLTGVCLSCDHRLCSGCTEDYPSPNCR